MDYSGAASMDTVQAEFHVCVHAVRARIAMTAAISGWVSECVQNLASVVPNAEGGKSPLVTLKCEETEGLFKG